jgi:hypothetical protein
VIRLRDRLRRWWKPAQRRDDHPLTEDERLAEQLHESHWWNEAQNAGLSRGRVDVTRDLKKPKP